MRPHRWQPTRLPRPWDSPGKNTGVGCHFLLQCMKVKVKSLSCVQKAKSSDIMCQGLYHDALTGTQSTLFYAYGVIRKQNANKKLENKKHLLNKYYVLSSLGKKYQVFLHRWIYIKKRVKYNTQGVEGKINFTNLHGISSNSLTNITFGHKQTARIRLTIIFPNCPRQTNF